MFLLCHFPLTFVKLTTECSVSLQLTNILVYSRADWDGLRDHLRDVSWENIFKLSRSSAASKFCDCVPLGNNVYIPHQNY